jgi:hypothetical protein
MRNAVVVLVVLMLATAARGAPDDTPWAEKLFENKTQHDFGNVAHGTQMLHKFAFKNIYAVPLDVTITRISCGCTTASSSVQRIDPQATGTIDVNMNARVFTGPRTVRVSVRLSKGQEFYSTADLVISANSRPDIVFNPGDVNFGVVAQGQGAGQDITVEYAGAFDWKVKEVVTNGLPVEAKLEQLRTQAGLVGYKVSVSLKADAPSGSLKGEMYLRTNDPASPLLPVLVQANVQAALTVAPTTARVSARVNEARTATVTVRGNKAFRILAVEGAGEGVTVVDTLPDQVSETHRLTFRVQKSEAGDFRRKLQIKTDLQAAPVLVTVEGNVSP